MKQGDIAKITLGIGGNGGQNGASMRKGFDGQDSTLNINEKNYLAGGGKGAGNVLDFYTGTGGSGTFIGSPGGTYGSTYSGSQVGANGGGSGGGSNLSPNGLNGGGGAGGGSSYGAYNPGKGGNGICWIEYYDPNKK